jgi:hypothetical protein
MFRRNVFITTSKGTWIRLCFRRIEAEYSDSDIHKYCTLFSECVCTQSCSKSQVTEIHVTYANDTVNEQYTCLVSFLSSFTSFYILFFPCLSLFTPVFLRKKIKCIYDVTLSFTSSYWEKTNKSRQHSNQRLREYAARILTTPAAFFGFKINLALFCTTVFN